MKAPEWVPYELRFLEKWMRRQYLLVDMVTNGSEPFYWFLTAHSYSFRQLPWHIRVHQIPISCIDPQMVCSPIDIAMEVGILVTIPSTIIEGFLKVFQVLEEQIHVSHLLKIILTSKVENLCLQVGPARPTGILKFSTG